MVKRAVIAVLAGAFLAAPAMAQDKTLEDVLESYYEAVGGLDAWKNLESFKATGTMQMQGMEMPLTLLAKRPDKVRIEFTMQGMTGVQAFDGETAWMLMPFTGSMEPEKVPDSMARNLKEEADIDGPLIGYEEEGHQLELVGMEETEGTQAYKIKVTRASGSVQYYYLDAEYFVPIKVEGTQDMQGQQIQVEQILSDYKQVGGLMMPHSLTSQPMGPVITFEQIEVNTPIEDSQFTMPQAEGEGQQ